MLKTVTANFPREFIYMPFAQVKLKVFHEVVAPNFRAIPTSETKLFLCTKNSFGLFLKENRTKAHIRSRPPDTSKSLRRSETLQNRLRFKIA